ncbi:MAG: alanine/glycine:cation symporter family protein [Verrucomicrobiales bacterium]
MPMKKNASMWWGFVRKVMMMGIFLLPGLLHAQEEAKGMDERFDELFGNLTGWFVKLIFAGFKVGDFEVLWVVVWLALGGLVTTLAFRFINLSGFALALRTVRGKYSKDDDPGTITHFQALSTAVSGTVGLGNIAGVAIGISIGGPGVAFWLFLSGFFGMATKFAECTLGVKYREIDEDGTVHGGGMQYLRKGLAERGMGGLGKVLACLFAFFCVFASLGGGNVFQINQATTQLINVTGGDSSFFATRQWVFGLLVAILTGLVIIGGIRGIAKVTSKLVPAMVVVYILSALVVLISRIDHVPEAFGMIISEAFTPRATVTGGLLSAFIWGMRRATFSNEAGIGSAPIAHATVKTRKPASEGLVALLEPFLDTMVVCTMTSLILVSSMQFNADSTAFSIGEQVFPFGVGDNNSTGFGIRFTSAAFESVHSSFQYVLFVCVFLFAFSTLITWSFYGLQAWQYLFGKSRAVELLYKLLFCLVVVLGASASMGSAVDFSDASLFAMSIPNLIGVFILIPMIRGELTEFLRFTRRVDSGMSIEQADAETREG